MSGRGPWLALAPGLELAPEPEHGPEPGPQRLPQPQLTFDQPPRHEPGPARLLAVVAVAVAAAADVWMWLQVKKTTDHQIQAGRLRFQKTLIHAAKYL